MKTIGVIGNGYVGGATSFLGKPTPVTDKYTKMLLYDIEPDLCSHHGIQMVDLSDNCDFIFICLPTPMDVDGTCSTYIIKKAVFELLNNAYPAERIIVRSTVPVGTCKDLGVMHMPEFLTEENWEKDFTNQEHWLLGTNDRNDPIRDELYSVFEKAYENEVLLKKPIMHFLTTEETELIKYVRNCFLATKISFFNEIYSFCKFHKIDYDNVRDMTILDDRIGSSHTKVPGTDGKRGFGGTCFPKDMVAFQKQLLPVCSLMGIDCGVVKSAISRNNKIDRPEQDWKEDKGRSVI